MTNTHTVIYKYFARLPIFVNLSVILTVYARFNAPHIVIPIFLMLIPFTLFFLFREMDFNKGVYIFGTIGTLGLSTFALFHFFFSTDLNTFVMMILVLYFMFIRCSTTRIMDRAGSVVSTGIAYSSNLLLVFVLYFLRHGGYWAMVSETDTMVAHEVFRGGEESFYAVVPLFIINVGLVSLSRYLCSYYSGLRFFTEESSWRKHSSASVRRLVRRGLKILMLFILPMVLAIGIIATNPQIYDFIFELNMPTNTDGRITQLERVTPAGDRISVFEIEEQDFPDIIDETYWFVGEMPERSEINEELVMLIYTILGVLVVGVPIIVILMRYMKNKKLSYRLREGGDDIVTEDYKEDEKAKTNERILFSANRAVRALFRKKVRSHMKKGLVVRRPDTAKKISDVINEKENIETLETLYHTARYSNEKLTHADIAAVKKGLK